MTVIIEVCVCVCEILSMQRRLFVNDHLLVSHAVRFSYLFILLLQIQTSQRILTLLKTRRCATLLTRASFRINRLDHFRVSPCIPSVSEYLLLTESVRLTVALFLFYFFFQVLEVLFQV